MKQESGRRLETIDALRGIAALMVVWWHVFDHDHRRLQADGIETLARESALRGSAGVYIFFVISGFIIPMAAVGSGRAVLFWRALAKRMVRLYPPFAASIGLAVLILALAGLAPGFAGATPRVAAGDVALNLVYLAPFAARPWINPVYWTLLIEVQYYFLIYAALANIERFARWALLAGLIAAAAAPLLASGWTIIFQFTDCFVAGFASFLLVDGRLRWPEGLAVIMLATGVALFDKGWYVALLVALTAWLCTWRTRVPRWLLGLGTISYSLYLTHYFVGTKAVRLFLRLAPEGDGGVVLAHALAMAACVAAAASFYILVERPAIAWSHRLSARPSP